MFFILFWFCKFWQCSHCRCFHRYVSNSLLSQSLVLTPNQISIEKKFPVTPNPFVFLQCAGGSEKKTAILLSLKQTFPVFQAMLLNAAGSHNTCIIFLRSVIDSGGLKVNTLPGYWNLNRPTCQKNSYAFRMYLRDHSKSSCFHNREDAVFPAVTTPQCTCGLVARVS